MEATPAAFANSALQDIESRSSRAASEGPWRALRSSRRSFPLIIRRRVRSRLDRLGTGRARRHGYAEGRIVLVNSSCEAMFGAPARRAHLPAVVELLLPEHRRAAHRAAIEGFRARASRTADGSGNGPYGAQEGRRGAPHQGVSLGTVHTPNGILFMAVVRDATRTVSHRADATRRGRAQSAVVRADADRHGARRARWLLLSGQ